MRVAGVALLVLISVLAVPAAADVEPSPAPADRQAGTEVSVLRAPASAWPSTTGDAYSRTTAAVPGDVVAFRFSSGRFAEFYAGTDGANAIDRFLRTVSETDVLLDVSQREPDPECNTKRLRLTRNATRVSTTGGTFTVAVNTSRVPVEGGCGEGLAPGDQFLVVLTVPTGSGGETLGGSFNVSEAAPTIDDDWQAYVAADGTIRVNGTVTVAPGAGVVRLPVRLLAADGREATEPKEIEATPGRNRFSVAFDAPVRASPSYPGLSAGDFFSVEVGNGPVARQRGLLTAEGPPVVTRFRMVDYDRESRELQATVTASLPEGGLLVVQSIGAEGPALAVERVPAGPTVTRVSIPTATVEPGQILVVVGSRPEGGFYRTEGAIASASAKVPAALPTATPTDARGPTPTVPPVGTTVDATRSEGAGLGFVAGLAGLAWAAALLARSA